MSVEIPENYKMNNSLEGMDHVERMPTGIRFPAIHMGNKDPQNPRIHFQIRYIVADDGKVYIGAELTNLFEDEIEPAMFFLQETLVEHGFGEIGETSDVGWFATDSSSIGVDTITVNIATKVHENPITQITSVLEKSGAAPQSALQFLHENGEDIQFSLVMFQEMALKKSA